MALDRQRRGNQRKAHSKQVNREPLSESLGNKENNQNWNGWPANPNGINDGRRERLDGGGDPAIRWLRDRSPPH